MAQDGNVWRERLNAILAAPAYHPKTHQLSFGGLLGAVWHWIATHIFVFHIPRGHIPPSAGYAVLIVALGATALFFRRLTVNPKARQTPGPAGANPRRAAADWLARADELLRTGEDVEASRLLFRAALAHLAQQGYIRLGPDKTNGEYVRALAQRRLPGARELRAIASDCDLLWYGASGIDAEELAQRMRSRVVALLGGGGSA